MRLMVRKLKLMETRGKNVVETIAHVQEMEERHGSAFKRRRRNIEELKEGLKTLEEGELLEDD